MNRTILKHGLFLNLIIRTCAWYWLIDSIVKTVWLKNFELNELKITAGGGTNLRIGVTTNNPPPVVVEALPLIARQTIKQL